MARTRTLNNEEICRLLEDFHPRLVSYANYFTHDIGVAEDLIQDAFYQFFRKYGNCTEEEFPRIIFKIARNRCLDHLKHQRIVNGVMVDAGPQSEMLYNYDFLGTDADCKYLYDELLNQVNGVLDRLPAKCRKVFEMSRFQQLSNSEIAESLGISIKTVKNHMTRALSEFRKQFGETATMILFFLFLTK